MEVEKVIFVLMIIVGLMTVILTVGLVVKEDSAEGVRFEMDSSKVHYPSYSNNQVLLSSQVNARNYCSG